MKSIEHVQHFNRMSQIKRLAARWLSGRARYVGFVFAALPGNAGRLVFYAASITAKSRAAIWTVRRPFMLDLWARKPGIKTATISRYCIPWRELRGGKRWG